MVQVGLIGLRRAGLVLGDAVDERVAGTRVLDEEAAHARGERAKIANRIEVAGDDEEDSNEGDGEHHEVPATW